MTEPYSIFPAEGFPYIIIFDQIISYDRYGYSHQAHCKEITMKYYKSKMKISRGRGMCVKEKRAAPKEGKRDIFLKCEK
jgi:hypothetical protein